VRTVMRHALVRAPEPIAWDEAAEEAAAQAARLAAQEGATRTAH